MKGISFTAGPFTFFCDYRISFVHLKGNLFVTGKGPNLPGFAIGEYKAGSTNRTCCFFITKIKRHESVLCFQGVDPCSG